MQEFSENAVFQLFTYVKFMKYFSSGKIRFLPSLLNLPLFVEDSWLIIESVRNGSPAGKQ